MKTHPVWPSPSSRIKKLESWKKSVRVPSLQSLSSFSYKEIYRTGPSRHLLQSSLYDWLSPLSAVLSFPLIYRFPADFIPFQLSYLICRWNLRTPIQCRHSCARLMIWWTILPPIRWFLGAVAIIVLWFGMCPNFRRSFYPSISSTITSLALSGSLILMSVYFFFFLFSLMIRDFFRTMLELIFRFSISPFHMVFVYDLGFVSYSWFSCSIEESD